jgi:hypothetical protein
MERCFSSWQRSPARGPGNFTTNMVWKWRFHHPQLGIGWKLIGLCRIYIYIYMDFDMFGCKSSRIIIHQTLLAGKLLIKISQIWSWTIHRLVVAEVAWSIISCHPAWDTSHEVPGSARVWR